MDRTLAVLEFIGNGDKNWAEIYQYCEKIRLSPFACRSVLADPKDPLVIEANSRVRLSQKGRQLIANCQLNAAILGEDWP